MPHLIIERSRSFANLSQLRHWPRVKDSRFGAYLVEILDIIAAVIFVAGSACFLPRYSHNVWVFYRGCSLFIVGSLIYCVICTLTFMEALSIKGVGSFEVGENGLYLLGSFLFLIGSILYLPPDAQFRDLDDSKMQLSLGQICEVFQFSERQVLATVLFIVASVLFCLAAFTNALKQRKFDEWSSFKMKMLSAVTPLYMGGSLLFALGSIAFLPHLGCGEEMVTVGAWCFIVGSVFFLIGSVLSLLRTAWVFDFKDPSERSVLVKC